MIKINNLQFGYKNNENILNDINLEIEEGTTFAVIGKNGSRKINISKTSFRISNS